MQLDMTIREAVLVRDAIRFFNEQQTKLALDSAPEIRDLSRQFADEREEVARRITDQLCLPA